VAARILNSGDQAVHLEVLRDAYKARIQILTNALACYPSLFELHLKPKGGYFLWVKVLLEDIDTFDLRRFAVNHFGVDFLPGECCHPDKSKAKRLKQYIRLCFACVEDSDDLKVGVERLARAIKAFASATFKNKQFEKTAALKESPTSHL